LVKKMEVKLNIECVVKILEKHGYKIENVKDVETGSHITANKEIDSKKLGAVELFQVRCGPPYVKFEAKVDDDVQRGMVEALNQGLDNLVKGAKRLTTKEPKNTFSTR